MHSWYRGKLHHSWKGGKPKCADCNKTLKAYSSRRCKSCVKKGNKQSILGAEARWFGHIKDSKAKKTNRKSYYNCANHTEYMRIWRKDNLEKSRFYRHKRRMLKKNATGSHSLEEWLVLKSFYKKMCLCCKKQEPNITLTKDHIIPLSKGGTDFIDNIQPLCASCNTRKYVETTDFRDQDMEGGEKEISLVN